MPTRSYAGLSTRPNVAQIRRELAEFGYAPDDINDLIRYTSEDPSRPNKEWKVPNAAGFITLRYLGHSRFTLEDHREFRGKRASHQRRDGVYSEGKGLPARKQSGRERDTHMATARGRRAATAPAPAPEPEANGEVDFQKYLDKDLSPTMQDYVEWFEENVAALEDVPVDKLLTLGSALYPHFQKSDFNIARREERKANRAPAPEPEPEPESAKPAAKGRGRGRAAVPAPEPAAPPARRRGRTAAKAGAEAPY